MKSKKHFAFILLLLVSLSGSTVIAFSFKEKIKSKDVTKVLPGDGFDDLKHFVEARYFPKGNAEIKKDDGCVFKTVFEGEKIDSSFIYQTPANVLRSIEDALDWIAEAQQKDGGWGAGTHGNQSVMDPHAVSSDPATTSIVAMALLRSGNTPTAGKYSNNLNKAMSFLMVVVENSPDRDINITSLTGTQPQVKLGQNIDVVLTSQFFTNVIDHLEQDQALKERVKKCLDKCVSKIQRSQDSDGSFKGSGWAGVLQSSMANNALETAITKGAKVNTDVLEKSREYQKSNYDAKTGNVDTDMGAGVMLYSISSSSRATTKESRYAKEKLEEAKGKGLIDKDEKVTVDNLKKSGLSDSEALKYSAAYEINEAAKNHAQEDDVMTGFGNNGGEEFLSYLQTGEGLIMGKDTGWKKWYANVSGRLVKIQNNDGSWNGHHCITSPVFCTATSLLILSVNNDVEELLTMGAHQ